MNQIQQYDFSQADLGNSQTEPLMTARDLLQVVWRHLWLIVLIIFVSTATAAFISKHTKKQWRASAELLLVQRSSVMAATSQAATTAPMIESIDTQISLLQSHNLAEMAGLAVGISADQMQGAASVTSPKDGDNVIDVDIVADSRDDAIAWDNALCNSFVEYKQEVAQRNSRQTLYNFRQQAALAKKQMTQAEAELLNFQKTHQLNGVDLLDTSTQKSAALNNYLAQSTTVAEIQNEYATAQAKASIVKNQLDLVNAALAHGTGVRDDSAVTQLQEQLQQLQMKRQQDAMRVTPKYPGVLPDDDKQIADLTKRLHDAIQSTLGPNTSLAEQQALENEYTDATTDASTIQVKLNNAIAQRNAMQKETESLPQVTMEADRLTENASDARALYSALKSAANNAELDLNVATGDVQVSEPAFAPPDPFTPNHKRDIALGFGVGVFLSLVAVLMLEQSDRSVRTPADVRRLADGPVIGVLSNLSRSQWTRFMAGETPPHLLETYNTARANLTLAFRAHGTKAPDYRQVILVSSSIAGEGKSLTASELAQSYARAGKKVVLVNADMRRPSSLPLLHAGENTKPGFAEVLNGDASVEQALFTTDVPNLSTIHSGTPKRNPVDLISTANMSRAMRSLRRAGEIIIIDTPPAVMVADALLIASHVDSILYVVGVGMVDAETVRNTAASLAATSPKTIAYFVNRAPKSLSSSPYYRHYGQESFELNGNGSSPNGSENGNGHKPGSPTFALVDPAKRQNGAGRTPKSIVDSAMAAEVPESAVRVVTQTGTRLIGVSGPYTGQAFDLPGDRTMSVGALANNDFALSRDNTIEPMHAFIVPEAAGYAVYDAGSAGITVVNGESVKRKILEPGDVVELGGSKFRFE